MNSNFADLIGKFLYKLLFFIDILCDGVCIKGQFYDSQGYVERFTIPLIPITQNVGTAIKY